MQCWVREDNVQADKRKSADRPAPANKLAGEKQQTIVDVCSSGRFKSLLSSRIVSILTDQGVHIGCEGTFYRTPRQRDMQQYHRGHAAKASSRKPTSYYATGLNRGGDAEELLANRKEVYRLARHLHPER